MFGINTCNSLHVLQSTKIESSFEDSATSKFAENTVEVAATHCFYTLQAFFSFDFNKNHGATTARFRQKYM